MDFENFKEGQYMQRPPLFEPNGFIYWKNCYETYVKSKDIDLWYIIIEGDNKVLEVVGMRIVHSLNIVMIKRN
jgi:hypothetical protein